MAKLVNASGRPGPIAVGGGPFTEPGLRFRYSGHAGEMRDARAKEASRRRLTETEDDLEEARALGDAPRVARSDKP